ncbi:MAG: hypothetical protein ACTSYB_01330 [Candidatus Helarchaeota archaeon]
MIKLVFLRIRLIFLRITEFPLELKISLLIASILVGWSFISIPSFTEFEWGQKIRHLYIVSDLLLSAIYCQQSISDSDLLFSGSLIAIQTLIQEMIKSDKSLRVIDHGDAKIIFEEENHCICLAR